MDWKASENGAEPHTKAEPRLARTPTHTHKRKRLGRFMMESEAELQLCSNLRNKETGPVLLGFLFGGQPLGLLPLSVWDGSPFFWVPRWSPSGCLTLVVAPPTEGFRAQPR